MKSKNNSTAVKSSALDIDRIDVKILTALQADARMTNLKLAELVTLSPTATLARVSRLQRDGFISAY
jgi:Lrp/AsnC family leucine-responsive transcriptional regulator